MTQTLVLKSFAELARVLGQEDPAPDPDGPHTPTGHDGDLELLAPLAGLDDLLAELEAARATLGCVARQDAETRELAARDLAQYNALSSAADEAERALEQARQVLRQAEQLAQGAFDGEARAAASGVAERAARAEAAAGLLAAARRRDAEELGARLDLGRLLAERRRAEEAERTRAATADRAARLSGALAAASEALAAGRIEEARELLGPVTREDPGNAELASLEEIIARRELTVKIAAAEAGLRTARRLRGRDPAAAVAAVEELEVAGLPELLSRQVFGAWAEACRQLCRQRGIEAPLRYAPDPGRGAVLVPEGDGYVVLSALGMGPAWRPGSPVGSGALGRARPLR